MEKWDIPFAGKVKKISPYLILILAQQIIYFRLSFTPFSRDYRLGGDFLTFHYLINLFNSDAYRAGIVPLWNPYIHSGFPWATGLEYKVFYPVQILVSLIVGYSYEVMQREFMLMILVGGIGVYRLLQAFKLTTCASLFGAISFLSSGIFVGNSQHFGQIIVYAFTPWIILQIYHLYNTNHIKHAIYGSIFLALAVTGGYSGTYIVLAYVLVAVVFFLMLRNEQKFRLLGNIVLMGGLALGLSAVHLLQGLSGFHHTSRASGLPYDMAVVHDSLAPINLFTAVLPKAATNPIFAGSAISDMSMWNFHLGAILPCLMFVALGYSKNRGHIWLLFALSIVLLLAAFGDRTPIRPFTYEYLPWMDKLRLNSAIFRGFTILGFCIIASFGLHHLQLHKKNYLKYFSIFLIFPSLLLLSINLFSLSQARQAVLNSDMPILFGMTIAFVAILFAYSRDVIKENIFTGLLIVILVFNFTYAVQVNSAALWAYDPTFRRSVESLEKSRDRDFQVPWTRKRIHQYPKEDNFLPFLYRVNSNFGPSSTILLKYENFMKTAAALNTVHGAPVTFPDSMTYYGSEKDVIAHLNSVNALSNVSAIDPSGQGAKTVRYTNRALADIPHISLNSVQFKYYSEKNRLAVLNQVYYPGWQAIVEETGQQIPISEVNLAFTGLHLPAGTGTVVLEYRPRSYLIGKWISIVFVFLTIATLAYI